MDNSTNDLLTFLVAFVIFAPVIGVLAVGIVLLFRPKCPDCKGRQRTWMTKAVKDKNTVTVKRLQVCTKCNHEF